MFMQIEVRGEWDNDIHHEHQRLGRNVRWVAVWLVRKSLGGFGNGVSVNKPATCSAAKINICINKTVEGRRASGGGVGSRCAVVSVYIACFGSQHI